MAAYSFQYGEDRYPYRVVFDAKLNGKIAIRVHCDGEVRVEAPEDTTPVAIGRAVLKRARWIKRQIDFAKNNVLHVVPREYVSGETHFYLGRRYRLKIHRALTKDARVALSGGAITVASPSTAAEAVKEHLEHWYHLRAQEYFSRRLSELVIRMRWLDQPPPFRLVKMRHQWGSCSPLGRIALNPALIKAPRDCIEYVIVHELCHLKEHNHSRRYYRLMAQHMPQWQVVKRRLDSMAELILGEGGSTERQFISPCTSRAR